MYSLYVLLCLELCSAVLGDYRVEVQLVQYTGTGRLSDGTCCDLELDTSCSPAETCDVQFVFRIRNIGDITVNLNPQTKGAGRYDNTNRLNFVNCAELPTTGQVVASNPLAFTIPSTNWTGTDILRVTIDAQDYDPPVGNGAFTLGQIGSPFFDINRPSAPNEAFTAMMTSSMGQATITYRYRVICTDGSCGKDCSQTTGCNPWTPACESITTQPDTPAPGVEPTSPLDPCVQNPCCNGGTCMPIRPGEYRCNCRNGFTGIDCLTEIDGTTTATPSAHTTMGTDFSTTQFTFSPTTPRATTSGGAAATRADHWVTNVVAYITILLLGVLMY